MKNFPNLKIETIEIKCNKYVKDSIEEACKITGETLEGFIIGHAFQQSYNTIERHNRRIKEKEGII